ncbi:MAG: HD domain-containing protein [Ruminococcus sp.]|nr:HD domain-containing protein [Ruminococcus sp.]
MIEVPEFVSVAIERLNASGFEAFAVGGCVRDLVLKNTPHDWDITTSAEPDEIKEVFKDFKTFDVGKRYGTVSVIIDSVTLEITTYRSEGNYQSHRKPQNVSFVKSLEQDLKRRDFTMNALCICDGEIIDMFGGINDINNKTIRAIGNPDERFAEDALRILRALRFSSVSGFGIEKETKRSIYKNRWLLRYISRERIRDELLKLLCGKNVKSVLLEYKEIIAVVLPEVRRMFYVLQNTPHHKYDVYTHTVQSVENIKPDPTLRLTMLLHDIGKPQVLRTDENGVTHFKTHPERSVAVARKVLKTLKLPKEQAEYILSLIKEHDNRVEKSKDKMVELLLRHGYDRRFFEDYLSVRFADTLAQSEYLRDKKLEGLNDLSENAASFLSSDRAVSVAELKIDGKDLLELGFRGKQIGDMQNRLAKAVAFGEITNTREELISFAKSKK